MEIRPLMDDDTVVQEHAGPGEDAGSWPGVVWSSGGGGETPLGPLHIQVKA